MNDLEQIAEELLDIYDFNNEIKNYENIYIYGNGNVGKFIFAWLVKKQLDFKVRCFFTTDVSDFNVYPPVKLLDKNELLPQSIILLAGTKKNRIEMINECKKRDITKYKEISVLDCRDYDYYEALPIKCYPIELRYWYRCATGEELNLDNPISFNEKINWMKLYDRNPVKTELADKLLAREYVKKEVGDRYLVPILGVWDKFDDIIFEKLPNRFVLKCNHGSGWNLIVKDKAKLNLKEVREKMNKWMATNYAFVCGFELHYKDIQPRIIAEKYLENSCSKDLVDYKIHCFNGIPKIIQVIGKRDFDNHCANEAFFDVEWNPIRLIHHTYNMYDLYPEKPKNLYELLGVAEKLSKLFKYVRVDLYSCDGKVYFGEMTFTPASGIGKWGKKDSIWTKCME